MSDSTYPQIAEVTGLLGASKRPAGPHPHQSRQRKATGGASSPRGSPGSPQRWHPPAAAAPAFLTTAEAAQRLGMSKKGLEQLRARGKGPRFVRIGNAVRYPVDALLESGKGPLQ